VLGDEPMDEILFSAQEKLGKLNPDSAISIEQNSDGLISG